MRWSVRNFNVRNKLLMTVVPTVVLGIAAVIGAAYWTSARMVEASAYREARSLAVEQGRLATQEVEATMTAVRTLVQAISTLDAVAPESRRATVDALMKGTLSANPGVFGLWGIFEPNAIDTLDATSVGKPGSNDAGRFTPGYVWSKGTLTSAATAEADALKQDYYLLPKQRKAETVLPPYLDDYSGQLPQKVIMTSVIVPVMRGDAFLGAIGADFGLSRLSDQIAQLTPYETGYAMLVAENGNLVAHPSKELAGKSVLDLVDASQREPLQKAIAEGREYVLDTSGKDATHLVFTPIAIGNGGTRWSFAVVIPKLQILSKVRGMALSLSLIGLVASALLGALVYLIAGALSRPIEKAASSVRILAEGDLSVVIDATSGDEVGQLLSDLSHMTDTLRDVVGEVQSAAEQVASGATQLSASAEQMSDGAGNQASSIEEISASVEQMSANIAQNAENAQQTDRLAVQSAASAEEGGKAVRETVTAMRKIAGKISIVEEIARQTNLLALNAAIEAARAGEQGRGFAVVASEVRKLAERSQAAAAEIAGLSAQSVSIAEQAGSRLEKLVPDIQMTAQLVQEITASCAEQSIGAQQVNRAVQQLDAVVQQNASSSEQMASTAEELSSQARTLRDAIDFFRIDGAARAGKRSGPRRVALPERAPQLVDQDEIDALVHRIPSGGSARVVRFPRPRVDAWN